MKKYENLAKALYDIGKYTFISLLLIIFLPVISFAGKPLDVEEYSSLDGLSSAVSSYFESMPKAGKESLKLAVIPVTSDRERIAFGLAKHLAATGRFSVLEPQKATAFLKDAKQEGPALIAGLAGAFSLDVVAAVRTYSSDGKTFVALRIFHINDIARPTTLMALLNLGPEALQTARRPEFGPKKELPALPVNARYISIDDLDGDGAAEYIFSDGSNISIYRLGQAGWQEVWAGPSEWKAGRVRHLNLDVADINSNGKPEIFVTFEERGRVSSAVFEVKDGAYQRIAVLPGFVRVVSHPVRGLMLLGQDHHEERVFSGAIKQYVWSDGKYATAAAFPLPKGVGLYGFVFADFGEQAPLIVSLSEKDRLMVYSGDALVWESAEKYGAAETVVVESVADIYSVQQKAVIKGRIAALDIDNDGKDELIIPKNTGGQLGQAEESEIICLAWTGARLDPRFSIKGEQGAVLDFQAMKQKASGAEVVSLIRTKAGMFAKPAARLAVHTLR